MTSSNKPPRTLGQSSWEWVKSIAVALVIWLVVRSLLVEAFRRLCDGGLEGWELHLAGSVHRSRPEDVHYVERVRALAAGYPVVIHEDAPLETVR